MKLVMTLITHNEDDILRDCLEYHLSQGVDQFLIMNHRSTDKTQEILEEYEAKGVADISMETTEGFFQARWVSELARKAFLQYQADWVINNDTDEFWFPDRGSLKDFFSAVPSNVGYVYVPRFDFSLRLYTQAVFYQAMPFREAVSKWNKCCHRGVADIVVEEGNHGASSQDMNDKGFLSRYDLPIKLYHYPVRSYIRYRRAAEEKGNAYSKNTEAPKDANWHWLRIYRSLKEGKFDEAFGEKILADDQINWGIQQGKYVVDDRLAKYFHKMKGYRKFI